MLNRAYIQEICLCGVYADCHDYIYIGSAPLLISFGFAPCYRSRTAVAPLERLKIILQVGISMLHSLDLLFCMYLYGAGIMHILKPGNDPIVMCLRQQLFSVGLVPLFGEQ